MRIILWCLCSALLFGCTEGVVFQEDLPIPNGTWDRSYQPEFAFDITDTISQHDVFIDVRHTG
ncbi:MAG TPA: hypothetical protein PK735_04555, partial [Flavobacteriales bacterium]|nr:hypothetical protein [Flavobacteriales bacterium]